MHRVIDEGNVFQALLVVVANVSGAIDEVDQDNVRDVCLRLE